MPYMNSDIERLAEATRQPRLVCINCKNKGEHYELTEYIRGKDNRYEIEEFEEMKKYGVEDKDAWYSGGRWAVEILKVYKCRECGQISVYQFTSNEEDYQGLMSHLEDQWEKEINDSTEYYYIQDKNRLYPEFQKVDKYSNERIKAFSPKFIEIYNQALKAEALEINEISGMGFRKALEFLIKDYAILRKPDKAERIKEEHKLGVVVDTYCKDVPNFQICAQRASWLGNDEVHYIREWKDKDLRDLKQLIELAITWIEARLKIEEYEINMRPRSERCQQDQNRKSI